METKRIKYFVLHLMGFLDLFAISLVIPAFPIHIKSLGASATLTGVVTSIYGALQLFSSPLIGKWSDQRGRLNIMLICLTLSSLGYFLSSYYTASLVCLAFLRVVPGVFKHTLDLCRCCLIEEYKDKRNQVLGSFNAVSSVGFIIGPTIHGHLVEILGHERGMSISFLICSLIFMINFMLVLYLRHQCKLKPAKNLPCDKEIRFERHSNGSSYKNGFKVDPSPRDSPAPIGLDISKYRRGVFFSRFFCALAVIMFRSSFVLWLTHHHPDLSPSSIGYILSYNGFLGLVFGFSVGAISNLKFYKGKEEKLHFHATLMVLLAFSILLISQRIPVILVAMTILVNGTAVLRVCGLVLSVKHLKGSEIGKVQGLGSSILSIARFMAPLSGGLLLEVSFTALHMTSFTLITAAIAVFHFDSYKRVQRASQESKNK